MLKLNLNRIIQGCSRFNTYSVRYFSIERKTKYSHDFKTINDSPRRSQRGIWQGKRHGSGYRKTFSMVHNLRKFKVNVNTVQLYSKLLEKTFYLPCSKTAERTIEKYGGLDNYLLKSSEKLTKDSQFATYLRTLLKKKIKDKYFIVGYLPFTQLPRFRNKKRERSEIKNLPSIYIPPEAKRTDISESFFPVEHFQTRLEKAKREEIERKIEQETDPAKVDELKKEITADAWFEKLKNDMKALETLRHKQIRNHLVRLKDNMNAKLNFLKTLESSENYAKTVLKEDYRHFSEDYPEVQLILQQTEQDKVKKNKLIGKMYKEYSYDFGEIYEDSKKTQEAKTFEPFQGKSGKSRESPLKKSTWKKDEEERLRKEKKEKKMNQVKNKKLELKFKVSSIKH